MKTKKDYIKEGLRFWAVDVYRRPGWRVTRYYVMAEDRPTAARIAGREHAGLNRAGYTRVDPDTAAGPAHYILITKRGIWLMAVDWRVNHPYEGGRVYLAESGRVHVW